MKQEICGSEQSVSIFGDVSSDAEFFVAIGVIAWLFVIGAIILYTVFSPMYSSNPLLPIAVSNPSKIGNPSKLVTPQNW